MLYNILSTIFSQFVNVGWQAPTTVGLLFDQRQRFYRHSCNRRCASPRSRSPRQRWTPAYFALELRNSTEGFSHLALPASCYAVQESSLRKWSRSVHSPSIVLEYLAKLARPCQVDSAPLDPKRRSRCRCVLGWAKVLAPPQRRSPLRPTYELHLQWRVVCAYLAKL